MAFSTSRLGAANGAETGLTQQNALFLKQFSGEVITAFETSNVMMPLHTVRTISQGKSAQFPIIGTGAAEYHTAGDSLLDDGSLASIKHNERLIHIDDLLTSYAFIDSLDEAKNHYDFRSEYSRKLGYALSKTADEHLLRVMYNASQTSAGVSTEDVTAPQGAGAGNVEIGGSTGADDKTVTSAALVTALFDAAAVLDMNDVPDQERYVVLNPTLYYALLSSGNAAFNISSSVANTDIGGSGFDTGKVPMIAGFEIYKSNNLPTADRGQDADGTTDGIIDENLATDKTLNPYYHDKPTNGLKGLVFHKGAIGTVKLRDLSMESEYQIERQGSLMVAKYAMGHGILRPDCAIALINAA